MAIIWENKFDSGVFDGGLTPYNSVNCMSQIVPGGYSGPYCARFTVPGTVAWERASVWKLLGTASSFTLKEVWLRGYVKINSFGGNVFFLTLDDSGSRVVSFGVASDGRWLIRASIINSATDMTYIPKYSTALAPLNQWVLAEVHIKRDAVAGEMHLYINGVLVASRVGLDLTLGKPHYSTGNTYCNFIVGHEKNALTAGSTDIDSIAVGDAQIGPEGVTVNPKLTVNSSPELNVPVYVDEAFVGNTPIIIENLTSGQHTVRVEEEVTR